MIEFFKKKRRGKKGKGVAAKRRRRIPIKPLAPVEEIVEQGILVADVAIRMNVKNTIIMNALRRGKDYDEAEVHEFVRKNALSLAKEREKDAKHIRRMRDEIRQYGRSAWQESEYASDDLRTLKHRQEVYERMKTMLEERAVNPEYIEKTAQQAQAAAWGEVGDSLKERASHPYYAGGSSKEYQRERTGRIQSFIEEDLAQLIKESRGETEPESTGSGLLGMLRKKKN